jgi:hypothetical protein
MPLRCMPMRCTPVKCTPLICMPWEMYAYEVQAHEIDICKMHAYEGGLRGPSASDHRRYEMYTR